MIVNTSNSLKLRPIVAAMMLFMLLAGCASTTDLEVDLSQNFPSPLVVPSPVHMGIYISPEFEQYVFQEFENIPQKQKKQKRRKQKAKEQKSKEQSSDKPTADQEKQGQAGADTPGDTSGHANKATATGEIEDGKGLSDGPGSAENVAADTDDKAGTQSDRKAQTSKQVAKPDKQQRLKMRVALGDAQARMVRAVLPPVFEKATLLESLATDGRPAGMDLYVVPEVKRLQYTTPKSTRTKVYEIWLQYDFVIYDRNDDVVTRWNLPCYGKTPSAMMTSQKEALQAATQIALRDCGAAFSTGFSVHPAVQRWLKAEEQRQQQAAGRAESL